MPKNLLFLLIGVSGIWNSVGCPANHAIINSEDSVKIANSALGFYNWYIRCLNDSSTYNIVQPLYTWKDTTPILLTEPYLRKLHELNVVSEDFIHSEKKRFKICQDSLNRISYKKVMECGCSVGEFFTACGFLDYYYWISSQERFDGCEVKEIVIRKDLASCQLIFYWNSEHSDEKDYDKHFICTLILKRTGKNWLIESIERKRN